jgi:hypothetical protein
MILVRLSGKSTSRNRILYPQMMRCFSVCWRSQLGHLYVTNATSKSLRAASVCAAALNCGDSVFSSSQNLSRALGVRLTAANIMIFRKRSYRWPLASEKTWIVSRSSAGAAVALSAAVATAVALGPSALPPNSLRDSDDRMPLPPAGFPLALPPPLSAVSDAADAPALPRLSSRATSSKPGRLRTVSCVRGPVKSRTTMGTAATDASSSRDAPLRRPNHERTPSPPAAPEPAAAARADSGLIADAFRLDAGTTME